LNTTESQFDKVAEEYDFVNALLNDYSFFVSNMSPEKGRALESYYDEVVGIVWTK